MGQNTLMFEVGLQRAKDKYQEIYNEVMTLIEKGGSTIKLKVQLDKASDVQDLVKQLSSLGDGTLLKPLLDRIDKLKTQLDVLGVDGSRSIERLKTEYNEATEAVQKYYRMVKQMEANIAGAKTPELKKTFEKNLEAYKSNNKIEELTNRQVTAQLNLSAANENVAKTALAASAALSNVGQGAAIKEVKDQVEALAKGLNDIVNEMKSIGNIGGGNLVKNVSKADEKTTQIAQALTKAMQDLAAGKEGAAGKEKDLAASTRDVNQALSIEKELANETAGAMNTAANAITAAAIAAKSLAVVMGGNSGDVNKFIELATRLETLNAQTKLVMQAPNMTFDAKTQSLAKTREEIELVRKEMDELKKNAAVGNPLIDSFTTAFNALNQVLSSSGNLLKTAAGNMGELNANIGSVISKGNIGGTVAAKKEVSIEQKGTVGQNNLFEPQKYTQLQDAIDKIVKEINRLREALAGIGEIQGITKLTESINGVYHNVNSLKEVLGQLQNAFKFTASTEELAAYEAKIKSLQQTITQLEGKANELTTSLNNVSNGIKTQAEKKGTEDRLVDNLQKLKTAITDIKSEYARLNEAYGQAQTMGMPQNDMIEKRLFLLRELIRFMQDYATAATKAGTAEADALSKSKAFSFLQFNGNQLFSKENTRLYSSKDIDGYIKMIEEFVKAEGRMAQTSGAATNTIAEIGTAIGRAAERASQAGFSFSQTASGIQNFAMNVETARLAYDKTLRGIADLENRISAGQKANMDKDTLNFMNGLKIRAQQWADVLKKILGEDLKGNPAYKEFLSMSSSILTKPQMGNGLQALLGSEWKILLKDIGSTFSMLMKFSGFNKELTLDNASISNWLKAEEAVRRLDNALKDLNRQWEATNKESRSPDLTARYEAQKRAIESLIAQLKGAMTDEARMANRNGLADLLGVGFKNAVGYDNKRLIQDLKATGNDAASAESRIRKLGMAFNELKGYIQANGGSEAMRKLQTEIQQAIQKMRQLMNAGDFSGAVQVFERISGAIRQATSATKEYEKSKQQAASANNQLTSSEQLLANAIKSSTDQMKGQSQILSDLKMMATQYLSVWGAQSFLNNIIETGGQLEMQRMSIGAILQDVSHANTLFDKIKSLALKSPFGVVELDQMTKQLTAYGFKYNELFDMTRRLADISAATGTGVDRLALALGHVRSEAALSGYTLRQFSMGNVPLLAKLSEKLGKSTEEIRKMVRVKGISYEDVVGVLKDLTNKGGMFYNMQEVISESVKAKFKNVRDAMDIMYGEMAEGAPGDALKGIANALMDVTKNWRDVITVLGTGTALWGAHRLAVLAYTKVVGTSTAATLSSIAAFRKKEAAMLRQASWYRTLTDAEKSTIATSKLYTATERIKLALGIPLTAQQKERIALAKLQRQMDLMVAMSTKKLTAEELAKMVALGKLSQAEALEIINNTKMAVAEKEAAIAMVTNVKAANSLRIAWNGVAIAGVKVAQALKGLMATLFSPSMLVMAGITAAMELWQRHSRQIEMAEEAANRIHENAQEAMKNTRAMFQETGISVQWKRNKQSGESDESYKKLATEDITSTFGSKWGGAFVFIKPKFDPDSAKETMERWKQYIRDYAEFPNAMLNDALYDGDKLKKAEEQFNSLANAVKNVAMTQVNLRNYAGSFESALKSTGGWLNDDLITNVKDYQNALKNFGSFVGSVYKEYGRSVDRGIDAAKEQDKAFAKAVSGMDTYAQQFKFLVENHDKYTNAVSAFKGYSGKNREIFTELQGRGGFFGGTGWRDVQDAELTMNKDLQAFYIRLKANLQTQGVDLKKMTKEQQEALVMGYKNTLTSVQGLSEDEMNELIKLFAQEFNIKINLADEKFQAKKSEIVQQLEDLLNGREWAVKIDYSDNINDVIKEARDKYKKGTEYFNNAKPILLKFGVKWEEGKVMSDEEIEKAVGASGVTDYNQIQFLKRVLKGMNEAQQLINNATDASKAGGFTLDDPNKQKKGGNEDKKAKEMREQIKLIKDAYDWYKKYDDQLKWSPEDAFGEIKKKYGDTLGKLGIKWDDEKKGITEYRDSLQALLDKAEALYKQPKHKNSYMMDVIKELKDAIQQTDFDKLKKNAEDTASAMTNILNRLSQQWSIYKSVLSATGNRDLAQQMAGLAGVRSVYNTQAEDLRNSIIMSDAPNVDFSKVFTMSDKEIEEYVGSLGLAKDMIDAVINSLKEWKKLQQETITADINSFATLLGGLKDYESEVQKIDAELKNQKESNERLATTINPETGKPYITEDQRAKADRIAEVQAEDKKWQKSSQYINLINNTLSLTKNEIEQGLVNAQDMLNKKLEQGLITVKEYADEMAKLKSLQENWDKGSIFGKSNVLTNYLTGGETGMRNYLSQTISKYVGKKDLTEGERKQYNNALDTQKGLDNLDKSVGKTKAVFDTLAGALQPLIDIFNQLGMTGVGQVVGGVQSALSGAATGGMAGIALGGMAGGPIGAAIGAGLSVVSTVLGGVLSAHDDALQDEIDASKQRQKEMERLSKNVERILGEVLGGVYEFTNSELTERDREDVVNEYNRRKGLDDESKELEKESKNKEGMWSALALMQSRRTKARAGSDETLEAFEKAANTKEYYDIQRATMMAQKDELIRQRNAENDKKDSDDDAIASYNQQIRELEDSLKTFAKDMAKALYDIDLKDWASQLTDAVVEAWEKGEDAAEAYKKKVREIVKDLTKNMLAQKVVEAAFGKTVQPVIDKLMDENSGVLGPEHFMKIADGVNAVAEDSIKTITGVLDAMEAKGYIDKGDSSSSGLSSNIKNITEETADILASYVNAIRADVAVDRAIIAQYFPMFYQSLTSSNDSLKNIEENTAAIMRSNDAIKDSNQAILDRINGLKNGTWQVPVA